MPQVTVEGDRLTRRLRLGRWSLHSSLDVSFPGGSELVEAREDPLGAWWRACLRGGIPAPIPPVESRPRPLRVLDLFSGVGGLMVGVQQLAAEAGRRVICELAVDTDADALAVHALNHRTRRISSESVTSLIDYRVRDSGSSARFVYPPELLEDRMLDACQGVDLVAAGPPCQGHSNLNNHSRRSDPRNLLYLTVPAFAVACSAQAVIIENVTSVVHDQSQVVQTTRALLESCGYAVTEGVLAADAMGWPQTRKRHFLVARRMNEENGSVPIPMETVQSALSDDPPRSVLWAIGGRERLSRDQMMHLESELTSLNRDRIQWLFDNNEHDLALGERPECHQDGTSYGAVYGRMHAERPAPTITTGYMTPGRGRFIHPTEQRTITPAEAARIQGFPDSFRFNPASDRAASRSQLAKWIGDAVAMPLGYAAAASALIPQIAAEESHEGERAARRPSPTPPRPATPRGVPPDRERPGHRRG